MNTTPKHRVPHLRDSFIVAKVGYRAKLDRLPSHTRATRTNPQQPRLRARLQPCRKGPKEKRGFSPWGMPSFVSLFFCFSLVGCKDSSLSWAAKVKSPDGKWVASARTFQSSGIGTGEIGTEVDVNWTSGSQVPQVVVDFEDALDQPSKTPDDKNVGMVWLSSKHLEVTYKGPRTIDFQAIKCYGIDVSVRDISYDSTQSSLRLK